MQVPVRGAIAPSRLCQQEPSLSFWVKGCTKDYQIRNWTAGKNA